MIIHHGNGTVLEHNYMQQMSFVFYTGKGWRLQAGRKCLGESRGEEQALRKALWLLEERSSSHKDWSLDPSTHVTSQTSLEMSVTPTPRIKVEKG